MFSPPLSWHVTGKASSKNLSGSDLSFPLPKSRKTSSPALFNFGILIFSSPDRVNLLPPRCLLPPLVSLGLHIQRQSLQHPPQFVLGDRRRRRGRCLTGLGKAAKCRGWGGSGGEMRVLPLHVRGQRSSNSEQNKAASCNSAQKTQIG